MLLSCVVLVVKLQQSWQKDDDVAALQKRLNFIMKEKSSFLLLCTSSRPVFALHFSAVALIIIRSVYTWIVKVTVQLQTILLLKSGCNMLQEKKTAKRKKEGLAWQLLSVHIPQEFFVIFFSSFFRLNYAEFTWMCSNSLSSRFSLPSAQSWISARSPLLSSSIKREDHKS